ncbi:MAG: hypothetical protein VB018_03950 [Lachnospiraceae bacterium]|nr:hypothetical protein [Lachnospiraceae bacterium]
MNFEEALNYDLNNVFNNAAEFAKPCTVYYDGEVYENIPVTITGMAQDRKKSASEHDEGIFINEIKAYLKVADIETVPRKNHTIQIDTEEYDIKTVAEEMGEIVLVLEALDE